MTTDLRGLDERPISSTPLNVVYFQTRGFQESIYWQQVCRKCKYLGHGCQIGLALLVFHGIKLQSPCQEFGL